MSHAAVPVVSSPPASSAASAGKHPTAAEADQAFAAVRTALATYQAKPELPEALLELRAALRAAAELVVRIPRRSHEDPIAVSTRALITEISASGAHDHPALPTDLVLAQQLANQGWPGLLAAMLLVSAWQWPDAPALEVAPDWLWHDYAAWLFVAPQGFCAVGQTDLYAKHALARLEELTRWVERNPGSAVVRSALKAFVHYASGIPLYFSHQSLKRHAELRGRLLARAFTLPSDAFEVLPESRANRKLRVGFVNRHFGSQTETYTTIPTFEQLDPSRFEVILFAHKTSSSPLEEYCRSRAKEFYVLPGKIAEQTSMLRAASLDVVVFGTNVTAVVNDVTLLGLHRVAPLQVVNNSSCITSGLPEIDLYVSGALTEAPAAETHFTERLGLLPGPAHAFNYEADRQDPTTEWDRASLGIPELATVFVSAANYFKIIPEMQHAWAKLLAAVPNSYLVVHPFNPNWSSSYPIQRFCVEFDRVLKSYGVDGSRFVVSTMRFPSRNDVKELLRVGDVYLDTYPFGGVNSLIDPLELGLPVVVWEGETFRSRMGGALLRSLKLDDFIATNEEAYLSLSKNFAADSATRVMVSNRISALMERQPIFLDTLAASDSFGELLLLAFDELTTVGREAFRRERKPLRAEPTADLGSVIGTATYLLDLGMTDEAERQILRVLAADPVSIEARHFMAKILMAKGNWERAGEYLLATVQSDGVPGAVWRDLAIVYRHQSKWQDALVAIEAALRADNSDLESWYLFGEAAFECSHFEILQSIAEVVTKIAPDDARTALVVSRVSHLKPSGTV